MKYQLKFKRSEIKYKLKCQGSEIKYQQDSADKKAIRSEDLGRSPKVLK